MDVMTGLNDNEFVFGAGLACVNRLTSQPWCTQHRRLTRKWRMIPRTQGILSLGFVVRLSSAFLPLHGSSVRRWNLASVSADRAVEATSEVLGDLYSIQTDDESFLGKMAVPTFAATMKAPLESPRDESTCRHRGLEGALGHGPAFVADGILNLSECQDLISTADSLGFADYESGKNHHGALQMVVDEAVADEMGRRLSSHIDVGAVEGLYREMAQAEGKNWTHSDLRLVYVGLNRRWRVYRYAAGGQHRFAPHIDAGFTPSGLSDDGECLLWDTSNGKVVSRLTVLFYLNDDFTGGHTVFYEPKSQSPHEPRVLASVKPKAGSCLVFPQGVGEAAVEYAREYWPLHEGSPVTSGRPKYVIRSDVLFAEQTEEHSSDPLFQHDHLVRKTFMPRSSVFSAGFLSHAASLYNPHMGVENLGGFLYSFLRMTKKRRVVEIGAGYTSLWILQALADNDAELARIQDLQNSGQCRLLDWPWTNHQMVQSLREEPAKLLCVDNCEHQKETATGASSIAKSMGLDHYLDFVQGDAFDLELGSDSIDILWCDFGVGSRMRDFVASVWPSLRNGGFLLCHSTLTNQRTRDWLEATRRRDEEEITGLPPGEYVQVSLLEPHKHYQNSISVFQKRVDYNEPVYSEYA